MERPRKERAAQREASKMELGNFIGGHVARANRNLLVANALLVIGVVLLAFANSNYFYNFFYGPFPADSEVLAAVRTAPELDERFVTVSGQSTINTGIQMVSQTKNQRSGEVTAEEINSDYLILVIGDRLLITKALHAATHGVSFTGSLQPIPYKVHKSIVADLERVRPGAKDRLFPFMLDAGNYRLPGYVGLGVGAVVLLFGLWNIIKGIGRARDSTKSPIVQSVLRYGELMNTIPAIDMEVKQGLTKFGRRCATTKSWFFKRSPFGLDVVPLEKAAWAYLKVTKHTVNFIPAGKSHAVVIHSQLGDEYVVDMSAKHAERFMNELSSAAPWILCGYTDEIKAVWENNRAGFCEEIEARKV